MPFTLAHPAAVLPLLRGPLIGPALVAGAVAPDAPYFLVETGLPNSAQAWYEPLLNGTTSHGLGGVLTVDLPVALVLVLLFAVARAPLAPGVAPQRWRDTGWIVISALLGIATHLVWDELTWSRLVQHLSTVLGLAVVAVYLWRRRPVVDRRLLGAVAGVGLAGALVAVLVLDERSLELVLSEAAKGAIVAALAALAVYVAGWWLRRLRRAG